MSLLSLNDFAKQELGYQPGTRIPAAEAAKVRAAYQHYLNKGIDAAAAASRPAFTPSATEVALPDGRKVQMIGTSPNSAMVAPDAGAPKFERITATDGTVKLIDTMTGKAITAWDEQTGAPVKAPVRNADDLVSKTTAENLSQEIAKLQSGKGFYWFEKNRQADIAAKQAELNALINPSSVLAGTPASNSRLPAPTPQASPTQQASPSPTPQATPTPDSAFLSTPMPTPAPEATPAPTPISMSSADYQSKYGRAMKPGRYRTKSGAEVLITD